jgi:hypothetical protein
MIDVLHERIAQERKSKIERIGNLQNEVAKLEAELRILSESTENKNEDSSSNAISSNLYSTKSSHVLNSPKENLSWRSRSGESKGGVVA